MGKGSVEVLSAPAAASPSLTRADNPQAYLPGDRRRALAEGRELPDRVQGAALFADISGFTPLTEALVAELGPQRGAEELAAALSSIIDPLMAELDRHGGDVIYFSGDAVTAWIDGDDGSQAVACALTMQRLMTEVGVRVTPGGRTVHLGLKVAVAIGPARRFVVGTETIQLIDVLAGALMDRLAEAEHLARTGEVVLAGAAADAWADRLRLGERRGPERDVAVVEALIQPVVLPPPRLPLPTLPDQEVRKWLLPRVFERMSAGQGEFLAELRPGVPLFLRFGGIDYDDDAEAIAHLDDLVTRAQQIVDAYGGNVLQLTIGDKGAYLYAVFGAPVAHEDDSARACAAALELSRLGETTAATGLQIGIAAGQLRSGTYGHADRRTFCCLGDAVNLAARLMSKAPEGEVYVAAEVRSAAGADFAWDTPVTLRVAGKAAEVVASPLRGRRRGQRPATTALGQLVGRDAELAALRTLALESLQGTGRVAVITGSGGVGKSRLLSDTGDWLAEQGLRVRRASAQAYGPRTSYGVWADICRQAWDIDPDDPIDMVVAQLTAQLAALGPHKLARLPLLGTLLGVPIADTPLTASLDTRLRKTSLESLVVELFEASAARGPIALLIDAAEHMDELSWNLTEAIGRSAPRTPTLVLLARRPGDSAEEAEQPLAALPHVHRLQVDELDDEVSRQLAVHHVAARGGAALPTVALDRVVSLAGGNPFHLEELVNFLMDRGDEPSAGLDLGLPTSVRSLQLARIDALAESPRRTIKVASVVGSRFSTAVVAGSYPELGTDPEVADQLSSLDRAALIVSDPDLASHTFRNNTTHQVAYETLPFAQRSGLHDRVLSWLEDHIDNDAALDLLAFHATRGTHDDKRRDYLVRAGLAAQERYANDAAVGYLTAAIPLVEEAERGALLQRLGKVWEILGRWDQADEAYVRAADLSTERGDRRGWANAQADRAEVARKQGRFEPARDLLLAADEVFTDLDDLAGLANVLHLLGTLASQQSRFDEARASYRASLEIRRELDDQPKVGALLSNLAVVAEQLGEYDDARALNEQALEVRALVGDPWAMAVSHNNLGMIALLQHDYRRAAGHIGESMRLAELVGDLWIVAVGRHNDGIAQRGLVQYAASGEAFAGALQSYLDHNDRWSVALLLEDVAFLAVDTGQHRNALRLLGAADALRVELAAPRSPAPAQLLEDALVPARHSLGADAETAVAEGATAVADDIAALVRQVCRDSGGFTFL
ncbi:adenylate/guanylate cyclase domain-containing protein [Acidothermaceae bacterium B102]|nr:adenylate/guanylate cyclase domain-containing protein [Acidothermaceae bacterium B102]